MVPTISGAFGFWLLAFGFAPKAAVFLVFTTLGVSESKEESERLRLISYQIKVGFWTLDFGFLIFGPLHLFSRGPK